VRLYIITVLIVFGLDIVGKMARLFTGDTHRSAATTFIDAVVVLVLLIWGAVLIGGPA
jgi:hypothetical protein